MPYIYRQTLYEIYYDVSNIDKELYEVSFEYVNGLKTCKKIIGIYSTKLVGNINDVIWKYSGCSDVTPEYIIFLPICIIVVSITFFMFIVMMVDLYMLKKNVKYSEKKLDILDNIV